MASALADRFRKDLQEMVPDMEVLDQLQAYAFAQQLKVGPVSTPRPPKSSEMSERAKWEAWAQFRGMSDDDVKAKFVDFYMRMKDKYKNYKYQ